MKINENQIVRDIALALSKQKQCGLHIVINDFNVNDYDIEWCSNNLETYCPKIDIKLARQIIKYLLKISIPQRFKVLNKAMKLYHKGEN